MKLELVLSNTQNFPFGQQLQKLFDHNGGTIGRDTQCDFVLHCNEKVVSRLHAKIAFRDSAFYIYDASANGVFINGSDSALGDGNSHEVRNGDAIRIGSFTLQAKLVQESLAQDKLARMETLVAGREGRASIAADGGGREFSGGRSGHSGNLKLVSGERKFSGSSPMDSFSPPPAFIPPDWNSDIRLEQGSKTPADVSDKRETLRFTNQQTRLLDNLLKGLGANKSYTAEQLTPEIMELIGRSLRVAINSAMMNRKVLQEAKSELSLQAMPVERQMEADALGHIDGTESFITAMLDPHHKSHGNLANQLAESMKDLMDDQKDIYSGIPQVIAQVAKGLSPEGVDAAFEVQQNIEGRGKPAIKQLGSKLSQNSRKWLFYERHWSKLYDRLKADVHKFYESKMLLAHAKRMKNKNSTAT